MGFNLSGALGGASKGLGTLAELKINQEEQQARFLRDQNMARFQSSLLEERNVAAEDRAFLKTGSGLFDPSNPTKELTRSEAKDRKGLLTGVGAAEQVALTDADLKRTIAKGDREAAIRSAYPSWTPEQVSAADTLLQKKTIVGGKPVPAAVKANIYEDSRKFISETVDPDDPLLTAKVEAEYKERLGSVKEGDFDLEGAISGKPTDTPSPQAISPAAIREFVLSGDPVALADQEIFTINNMGGKTSSEKKAAIKKVEAVRDAAVAELNKKGNSLRSAVTPEDLRVPGGPARGTSVHSGGLL